LSKTGELSIFVVKIDMKVRIISCSLDIFCKQYIEFAIAPPSSERGIIAAAVDKKAAIELNT
jgi:hypothetical protein